MTDPRMTPTNDAPVTVKQIATMTLHLRNRADSRDCMGYDATAEQLRNAADMIDRLAALASAPAVDESRAVALVRRIASREPWQAHYGRTWEEEAADIVAGLHDPAPAGDGVEAATILRKHVVVETAPIDNATVSAIIAAMQEYAALARPRAAVGEDFLTQLRRVNTDRYHAWVGDGQDAGILFDAAELGGEVGELLNVVKKLEREDRGWRGSRAAPEDFADECADVLICLDKLARRKGVDLAAATVAKFNATSKKVDLPHRLALQSPPAKVEEC